MPIDELPPEILGEILSADIYHTWVERFSPDARRAALLAVCRSWRETAISTPSVWSYIDRECDRPSERLGISDTSLSAPPIVPLFFRGRFEELLDVRSTLDPSSLSTAASAHAVFSRLSSLDAFLTNGSLESWTESIPANIVLDAPFLTEASFTRPPYRELHHRAPEPGTCATITAPRLRLLEVEGASLLRLFSGTYALNALVVWDFVVDPPRLAPDLLRSLTHFCPLKLTIHGLAAPPGIHVPPQRIVFPRTEAVHLAIQEWTVAETVAWFFRSASFPDLRELALVHDIDSYPTLLVMSAVFSHSYANLRTLRLVRLRSGPGMTEVFRPLRNLQVLDLVLKKMGKHPDALSELFMDLRFHLHGANVEEWLANAHKLNAKSGSDFILLPHLQTFNITPEPWDKREFASLQSMLSSRSRQNVDALNAIELPDFMRLYTDVSGERRSDALPLDFIHEIRVFLPRGHVHDLTGLDPWFSRDRSNGGVREAEERPGYQVFHWLVRAAKE